MGIVALPAKTIRAIGSTQCLTDPASLVKELVENALDANAAAIFVEISTDTISKVKVKDNGHGIAPSDRSLVCKPYCTSKISSFTDLHLLGGDSLGFRGEALASAAELSSKIVLTTRVEGEPTAMELHYDQGGSIIKEKHTSHAVGTSIEIDNFLSTFPVRKQLVEKSSSKILVKIKKLLQAYALARSRVRFSLKVLKAKNEKGDFSHCPKREAKNDASFISSSFEAATNIFGRKAAEQLQPHTSKWPLRGEVAANANAESTNLEARPDETFILEFLTVKAIASDTQSINRLGQYISIDSRPVSCSRGLMKNISHHYRDRVKSTCGGENGNILDPLLVLNIRCPKGSYDVNVDPAKDEVLFTDTENILKMFHRSLDSIYGEPKDSPEATSEFRPTPEANDYDILFAQKPTENIGPMHAIDAVRADDDLEIRQTFPAFSHDRAGSASEQEGLRNINVSNPWSLANLCTPLRRPGRQDKNQDVAVVNGYLPTPRQQRGDVVDEFGMTLHQSLPRSSTSPVPFPYPIRAFGKHHPDDGGESPPDPDQTDTRCGALNAWLKSSGRDQGVETNLSGDFESPTDSFSTTSAAAANITSIHGTALRDIPNVSQRSPFKLAARKQRPNTTAQPSTKARNGPEDVWFPAGEHTRSSQSTGGSSRTKPRPNSINLRTQNDDLEPPTTHAHPDLANALDYEVRKVKATQDYREQLRKEQAAGLVEQRAGVAKQSTLDSLFASRTSLCNANSPHKNRQRKAVAALRKGIGMSHDTSAAEMVALPCSGLGEMLHKRRTKKLPLEEVEKHDWLADLVLPLSMSAAEIKAVMQTAVDWDDYVYTGESMDNGFDRPSAGLLKVWELRLQQLVGQQYRRGDAHVEDGTMLDGEELGLDLCQDMLTSRSGGEGEI